MYSVALGVFFIGLAPSVLAQMLLRGKYRRGIRERLGAVAPWEGAQTPIWLHAVSVGEVMAALPLARALRARRPEIPLLVSTTTETGRAVAEQRLPAARFVFFPLDFGWTVRRALGRLRPRLVLLTETELWPNFLSTCAVRGIPVVVINGRLSPRSFPRYRLVRWWFGRVLRNVRLFCMQSSQDAERIVALGAPADRVRVTGNLKYDFPSFDEAVDVAALRRSLGLPAGRRLVVAGSTHRGEEDAMLEAFRTAANSRPDLCLLIAPRHPERLEEVERLVARAGLACVRRSRAEAQPPEEGGAILLDTIGELARLYAAASVVFIGGSLIPHGGQNILEPAAHSRPVIHGPHMANFAEMRDRFRDAGAAIQVEDAAGLFRALEVLLDDSLEAERMGKAGRGIVAAHRGATQRTADLVDALL
ncbi:MAG TPA: 3-deoxy-D-manno-octulosonic acid transferase [Candidatus Methylomirabilis sp.]